MNKNLNNWLKYFNLIIFDEIDSTNEEAKRLVQSGVSGNFVIWAKSQSKGKGRNGKRWISPPGNFYLSLLIRPEFDLSVSSELSFVVAVAIGGALSNFLENSSKKIEYKWPNDVLINGKKLASILIETSAKSNSISLDWLIIGVGLNIISSPVEVSGLATNLSDEGFDDLILNKFVDEFMKSFTIFYDIWLKEGFSPIREKWLNNGVGIGEVITVSVGKDRVSGVFEDLTNEGCIKLSLPGGQMCYVSSEEIFYDIKEYNNCKLLKT
jgi:BirA family biotin operon repressor/biotin-[acetyl-CoA-carboxylase] ligase